MKNEKSIVAVEGLPFIIPVLLITIISAAVLPVWITIICALLLVFVTAFFRNPQRKIPGDPKAIISPADGKVIEIKEMDEPDFLKARCIRVCVFMNVFNVHINRIPLGGTIKRVQYFPGKFLVASLDKASELNERNAVLIEGAGGVKVLVVQIAGLVARRIVSYVTAGDSVKKGDRFGLIRFGSRLDLYLPLKTKIMVQMGEVVKGGETIMGVLP
jgi:phosphatidylserine decarboxylase